MTEIIMFNPKKPNHEIFYSPKFSISILAKPEKILKSLDKRTSQSQKIIKCLIFDPFSQLDFTSNDKILTNQKKLSLHSPRKFEYPKTDPTKSPLSFLDTKLLINIKSLRPQDFIKKFEKKIERIRPFTAFSSHYSQIKKPFISMKKDEIVKSNEFDFANLNKPPIKNTINYLPTGFLPKREKLNRVQSPTYDGNIINFQENIALETNLGRKVREMRVYEEYQKKYEENFIIKTKKSNSLALFSAKDYKVGSLRGMIRSNKMSADGTSRKNSERIKIHKNQWNENIEKNQKNKENHGNIKSSNQKNEEKYDFIGESLNPWLNNTDSFNDDFVNQKFI